MYGQDDSGSGNEYFGTYPIKFSRHQDDITDNNTANLTYAFDGIYTYPYKYFNNYDWNRGQILSEKQRDENENLLKKVEYDYEYYYKEDNSPIIVDGLSIGLLQNNYNLHNGSHIFWKGHYINMVSIKSLQILLNLKIQERHHYYPTTQYPPQVVYDYEYNDFMQLTSTSKSVDGDIYKKEVKRPLDLGKSRHDASIL
ncbi:MAG: hypothetical protein U5Q03_18115 [Bacteroidota bacterium]|nr:hypothetical protein [Bacteroidota bacterium]